MNILRITIVFVFLILWCGLCCYINSMIKRFEGEILRGTENKKIKIVNILVSIVITVLALNIFSRQAIILLHIVLMDMLISLVNFIIKKIAKNKYDDYKIWKKIYGFWIIPVIFTIVMVTYGYFNMMNIVETDYVMYSDEVREEGYKLALIADVHFGVSVDMDILMEKCNELSAKQLDMVVLCGDIVDENTTKEQMEQVFKALGKIENKMGIYYVYGNHDRQLYSGNKTYTKEELAETIEKNGIIILQDQSVDINDEFTIVGREDKSYEAYNNGRARKTVKELLADIDDDRFVLTLDHQPKEYEENEKYGTDLLLSGHTHRGQIWPANILFDIIKFDDAVYGETVLGKMKAFVTSGFAGWGFKIKTSAPAEYVIIDIKSE